MQWHNDRNITVYAPRSAALFEWTLQSTNNSEPTFPIMSYIAVWSLWMAFGDFFAAINTRKLKEKDHDRHLLHNFSILLINSCSTLENKYTKLEVWIEKRKRKDLVYKIDANNNEYIVNNEYDNGDFMIN